MKGIWRNHNIEVPDPEPTFLEFDKDGRRLEEHRAAVYRDIITGKVITPDEMIKFTSGNEYSFWNRLKEEWDECPWQMKTIVVSTFLMIIISRLI